jgi:hypothetical protein
MNGCLALTWWDMHGSEKCHVDNILGTPMCRTGLTLVVAIPIVVNARVSHHFHKWTIGND